MMNNVVIIPKHAQIAGYSISSGGFNVKAITSTQMKSQLLAPSSSLPADARAYILSVMSDAPNPKMTATYRKMNKAATDTKLDKLKLAGDHLIAAEKADVE